MAFENYIGGVALSSSWLTFNNTEIKGNTSISDWNQNYYTLATAINGTRGLYVDKLTNSLVTTGELDYANVISGDRDLLYSLKWNNYSKSDDDPHGTFHIKDGATLTLGVELSDNPIAAYYNKYDWDGKTLTKAGLGTLILNENSSYTGITDITGGTLKTAVVDALPRHPA